MPAPLTTMNARFEACLMQVKIEDDSTQAIFEKTGLIGCAAGPGDLSQKYKGLFSEGLYSKLLHS